MRIAEIYFKGDLAGFLIEENRQKYIFRYDELYFYDSNKLAISLTLPKTQKEYVSKEIFPIFSNMIAEGANLAIQCRYLKIDERDTMGLLGATAFSDTIGAITIKKVIQHGKLK
jgi:HipA-like protein